MIMIRLLYFAPPRRDGMAETALGWLITLMPHELTR